MAARECLAIVGVGLIGGSIGLAARRTGQFGPILGVDTDPTQIETAVALGCVDGGVAFLDAARRADVVVFCTPVPCIARQAAEAARVCRPGALLTDAGSTKEAIVAAVESALPPPVRFVGAHPLAGSEKQGAAHARPDLLDGRLAILTPTPRTAPDADAGAERFWRALGSRVTRLSPAEHDRAMARTSHLPHVAAAALAGSLPRGFLAYCATGFRDATRLASGDPAMWTAILLQNREHMMNSVAALQQRLAHFHHALEQADVVAIERLLREGKQIRDDLGG